MIVTLPGALYNYDTSLGLSIFVLLPRTSMIVVFPGTSMIVALSVSSL